MTKVFAYLRVSGTDQISGDGFPRQIEAIRKYAADNDIQIVRIFEEKAVCGETEWDSRPAWLEMLQALNGCKTIIIERLDRLARMLMVQEHIIADLKKRGITLLSVYEPDLDSSDPTRVLMRQIMGAISQYDRAVTVLKLRGARQRIKAATGRCEGRKAFGYRPGESEVLAEMRQLYEAGETPAAIARALGSRGSRKGNPWHPYVIKRILKGVK